MRIRRFDSPPQIVQLRAVWDFAICYRSSTPELRSELTYLLGGRCDRRALAANWKVRPFGLRRLLVVSQRGRVPEHYCTVNATSDERLFIRAEDERCDGTAAARPKQSLLFVAELRLQLAAGDIP